MHPEDVQLFLRNLPPPLGVSGREDLTELELEIASNALISSPDFDFSFNRTLISFASAHMLQEKRAKNPHSSFMSPEDAVRAVRMVRRAVRKFRARREARVRRGTGSDAAGGGGSGGTDAQDQDVGGDGTAVSLMGVLCAQDTTTQL